MLWWPHLHNRDTSAFLIPEEQLSRGHPLTLPSTDHITVTGNFVSTRVEWPPRHTYMYVLSGYRLMISLLWWATTCVFPSPPTLPAAAMVPFILKAFQVRRLY